MGRGWLLPPDPVSYRTKPDDVQARTFTNTGTETGTDSYALHNILFFLKILPTFIQPSGFIAI